MRKKISDYDKRQLLQIKNLLVLFENKKIDLASLVSSLEFLLNAMKKVDRDWEEKFLDEIVILESINARRPKLNELDIKIIDKSVINLKNLTEN